MKKTPKLTSLLSEGPLHSADKRLEDFCFNLYFSYVFTESVKAHKQLEDDYIDAFLEQDYDQMKKIDRELQVMEGAFEATACMLDATKEEYS
jgi:hypothetical protein